MEQECCGHFWLAVRWYPRMAALMGIVAAFAYLQLWKESHHKSVEKSQ